MDIIKSSTDIIQKKIEGVEKPVLQMPQLERKTDIQLRLIDDFITYEVSVVVPYSQAEDANYYPIFYVATVNSFLLEAKLRHNTNGGAAAEVNIEKLPSGTARGSGTSMLVSAFDISANAGTTLSKTVTTSSVGAFQLIPGDAMALRPRGTLTAARHVCVTALLGINMKDLPTSANV